MASTKLTIKIGPEDLADMFWSMGSDEQAVFFEHLFKISGSYPLMMQGIAIRNDCKDLSLEALEGYQYLFAAAYKYMGA